MDICRGPEGLEVVLLFIRGTDLGLYSPTKRISNWGDLDGEVESERGWWIGASSLEKGIQMYDGEYEVGIDLEQRGVNLKGKPCRMLASLDNGTVFVEFDEDVNGCSADGLGKTGHCVALKTEVLVKKKREKHAQ